jgi:hypothetical protein
LKITPVTPALINTNVIAHSTHTTRTAIACMINKPINVEDCDYVPSAEDIEVIRQEFIAEVYRNSFIFLSPADGDIS